MRPACAGRSWKGSASNTQKTTTASTPTTPSPAHAPWRARADARRPALVGLVLDGTEEASETSASTASRGGSVTCVVMTPVSPLMARLRAGRQCAVLSQGTFFGQFEGSARSEAAGDVLKTTA